MILVNTSTPGSYAFLQHSSFLAEDNIITFADVLFPAFLFCSGFALVLTQKSILRKARRTGSLFGLGLVYNTIACLLQQRPIRVLGVLQRIAISTFISSIFPYSQYYLLALLSLLWTIATYLFSCNKNDIFSPPSCTTQSRIDLAIFGPNHLYSLDYDPEGILGSITTAVMTVSAGSLFAKYLEQKQQGPSYLSIVFISLTCIAVSIALIAIFDIPMSKPLWTPPFTLITIATTMVGWLVCSPVDRYPQLITSYPLSPLHILDALGRRSLEIYLTSEIAWEFTVWSGLRGLWMRKMYSVMSVALSGFLFSTVYLFVFCVIGQGLIRYKLRLRI